MNREKIIITVFAKDQPGIVHKLSDTILAHDGNWLESSLSRLCGQFTGIIHIEVNVAARDGFIDALHQLSAVGIQINVQSNDGVDQDNSEFDAVQILVEANDRAGIVKEITTILATAEVNVEHMDTESESASMAGYNIFRAHLFLALPEGMGEQGLEELLENLSDDVMVSILED